MRTEFNLVETRSEHFSLQITITYACTSYIGLYAILCSPIEHYVYELSLYYVSI